MVRNCSSNVLGYDVTPVADLAAKVWAVYERIQPPETDPMLDFDERDLLALAEGAGFPEVRLEYWAEIVEGNPPGWGAEDWETLLKSAGNPKIPTIGEAINEALTPQEAERFANHLRPLVGHAERKGREAYVYMWTVKR